MTQSVKQLIDEIRDMLAKARGELEDLRKRVTLLELHTDAPAPRRGTQVPPTKLPERLSELEIGRQPKGT